MNHLALRDRELVARAFNEWMRRYIQEPERFEAEFQTVLDFMADEDEGKEPDYGSAQAAYLQQLIDELR